MANSVTDQTVTNAAWFDVLAADASFTNAVSIELQNKGNDPILIWIGTSAPSASATDGRILYDVQGGGGSPVVVTIPAVGAGNSIFLRSLNGRNAKVYIRAV